ncbi:RHH-type rel operon transcriptional repressor/antitoxin RelB [Paraburkholderia unamae]|uniref:RHH-type rel operon transcriptional repressor/antitoxin RelB n=1 Tax=Paraburkholderia unamae TaxID=219649 RepID=A0ABX5KK07_9BURK|nr:hypothetical protein [Paraburkholderia unamae]PVX81874.1 RHH-type rel operon transcriptional repressor/antitoxin RelB [Paraburkholderia unamae]RAR62448.1 RHH-type rel operon transcriptional repressor/antitoxin RelB [Paraburkholderia unamae]CAG9258650.1 hypothetical protein PUN4_320050 [Paraburkholderia unamae]
MERRLARPRKAEKLKVVGVRIDPGIERRLRLLAEATGRKPSFFLQQLIEGGIGKLEEVWLPPDLLEQVRAGALPDSGVSRVEPDLFD